MGKISWPIYFSSLLTPIKKEMTSREPESTWKQTWEILQIFLVLQRGIHFIVFLLQVLGNRGVGRHMHRVCFPPNFTWLLIIIIKPKLRCSCYFFTNYTIRTNNTCTYLFTRERSVFCVTDVYRIFCVCHQWHRPTETNKLYLIDVTHLSQSQDSQSMLSLQADFLCLFLSHHIDLRLSWGVVGHF